MRCRHNLYSVPQDGYPLAREGRGEIFEALAKGMSSPAASSSPGSASSANNNLEPVLIERIVSAGQTTPKGEWYDQERDEWVVLLKGRATLEYEKPPYPNQEDRFVELHEGDYIFIPAHQRHRVAFTSEDPPCVWLAVHAFNMKEEEEQQQQQQHQQQ